MQPADRLIDNLASLATVDADGGFRVVHDAAIAIRDGHIEAVGPRAEVHDQVELTDGAEVVDATGLSAVPGLVDCHTHVVYGGNRVHEFDLRAQGADYERIAAEGGGIRASVRMTRAASDDELLAAATGRLARMRALGTTTAEVKSGYGLSAHDEARMLRTARAAGAAAGVRVRTTCLALHATPPEAASPDAYVETAVAEILPACAGLAEQADVFLERGVFDVDQSRRYLEAARELGLGLRLHADQFSEAGAIGLAIELGAASVDHLEATGPAGVAALAGSEVIAVGLPVAALTLRRPMPPLRELLDAGGRVALATDANPGSAPCLSLPTTMHLACTQIGLSCAEALAAATRGGAAVLGLDHEVGRIIPGHRADVVLVDGPDGRALIAELGAVP
ncbi:MAG: imidazolonepropionase, partial [Actinomycetota bacterium]